MHVQGVVEAHEQEGWTGVGDLPRLAVAACPPVFGQPTLADGAAVEEPVAADRGLPDQRSDLLERRYFKDQSSVYGDTGPWRNAVGETWVRAAELPASVREDERWADVLDELAPHEREYGPENVRLVVWFEE